MSLSDTTNLMIKPNEPMFDYVTHNDTKVTLSPLPRGFGTTIGNALRRVLISSLPGCAISALQIPDMLHEFSSLKGVKEDMVHIILNLKSIKLALKCTSDKIINLKIQGPTIVTARMLEVDTDVNVMNPDQVICHVTQNRELDLKLYCAHGIGYVTAESKKLNSTYKEQDVGKIWIDSLFSPIEKVTFKVENTRIGRDIGYDKLVIEILANGLMKAKEAISYAAAILRSQLEVLISEKEVVKVETTKIKKPAFQSVLLKKVDELELSVRSQNCLRSSNIRYIGDLAIKSEAEILKTPNFGKKSLKEIKENLEKLGLTLGMKLPEWPPEDILPKEKPEILEKDQS